MRRRLGLIVAFLSIGAESLPQAFDLERALALPTSPGAIALLVEHTTDARAREKLSAALREERPEVRAAAARVIHAASLEALVPAVNEALARESDAGAATEMVMAVAGYSDSEASVLEGARRLDLAAVAAPVLAGGAGLRALDYLGALREMDSELPLRDLLRIASRDNLNALGPLASYSLRDGDLALWEAYLGAARASDWEVDGGLLSVSLSMKAMRPVTLWHAVVSGAKLEIPPADSQDPEEAFLVEILERQKGQKARDDNEWIARRASKEETPFSAIKGSDSTHLLLDLTKNERRALSEQFSWNPEHLDFLYELEKKKARKDEASKIAGGRTAAFATVSDFPNGLVADVLELTGCKPGSSIGIENAEVDYTLVGRPSRIRFVPSTVESTGCREAARAFILNSVVPPRALSPATRWDSLLVFLDPGFLSCLSEGPAFPLPGRIRDDVAPPAKIADFAPVYPPSALASRVTGTVHLDSIISPSGCVTSLRVTESPDSRLALASVIAASKWRYEPSLVEGKPVPVEMTLTVNFAVH